MKFRFVLISTSIFIFLSSCGNKEAENSFTQSSSIASTPTTNLIIVTEDYPPYSLTQGERIEGLSTEVVRAIFREAGHQPEIRLMSWARAYESARTTPGTLIYSISRTRERENLFAWIGIIAPYDVGLFALASRSDIQARPLNELTHLRVGQVRGTSIVPWFERAGFVPGKNLDLGNSHEAYIRKLFAGRIDLLPTNRLMIQYMLSKLGLPPTALREIMPLPEISSEGLWLAAHPKTDPQLIARLRTALEQVRASGEYQRIINR